MRRLARNSLYTQGENHEVRIQQLERRIPQDYPHWYGQALAQETNVNNEGGTFSFTFPDTCPAGQNCDGIFVTDGDYILFPTGHDGPFHVYMTVPLVGGFSNVDNPYVPVDVGVTSPSKRFELLVVQEIWRDNAPFGSITSWAYGSQGEWLTRDSEDALSDGRCWWLHWAGTGSGIFDKTRDRRALKFQWYWNKAADISFLGIVNVSIDPPDRNDTISSLSSSFFT